MTTVRRTVREKAFQTLYLMETRENVSKEEALNQAFSVSTDTDDMSLEEALTGILARKNLKNDEKTIQDAFSYLRKLINGILENKDILDEKISENLDKWTIQRIEKTNLLILRLAAYELLYEEAIDSSIVINEAVELAKTFNDDKASKFVNGVLQGVLDEKIKMN